MILSQTIGCVSKFGDIKAIELLAEAGFDAIDYSMAQMKNADFPLNTTDYKKYATELCEAAKRNNIFFNQGHAVSYIPCDSAEDSCRLLTEKNI